MQPQILKLIGVEGRTKHDLHTAMSHTVFILILEDEDGNQYRVESINNNPTVHNQKVVWY